MWKLDWTMTSVKIFPHILLIKDSTKIIRFNYIYIKCIITNIQNIKVTKKKLLWTTIEYWGWYLNFIVKRTIPIHKINQLINVEMLFKLSTEFWIKYTVLLLNDHIDKVLLIFSLMKKDAYINVIVKVAKINKKIIAIQLARVEFE